MVIITYLNSGNRVTPSYLFLVTTISDINIREFGNNRAIYSVPEKYILRLYINVFSKQLFIKTLSKSNLIGVITSKLQVVRKFYSKTRSLIYFQSNVSKNL